jgi:hypothetical protein
MGLPRIEAPVPRNMNVRELAALMDAAMPAFAMRAPR